MPKAIIKKINLSDELSEITSRADRSEAKEEIREYIIDTILDYVSQGKSPVKGEKSTFDALQPSYKKVKSKISGSTKPNMELFGDMLDELDARFTGNILSVGFHADSSKETRAKADNHNKVTGKSMKKVKKGKRKGEVIVPKRRFIPQGDQDFLDNISRDIKEIIEDYKE